MQKMQSFAWLHFKFNFQMQNKLLCLICRFLLQNVIFQTSQHFCFLCFHSRGRFFWFHKDREITKNIFTLAESNFSEGKFSCTRLNFGEIYLRERNGQSRAGSITPSYPLG